MSSFQHLYMSIFTCTHLSDSEKCCCNEVLPHSQLLHSLSYSLSEENKLFLVVCVRDGIFARVQALKSVRFSLKKDMQARSYTIRKVFLNLPLIRQHKSWALISKPLRYGLSAVPVWYASPFSCRLKKCKKIIIIWYFKKKLCKSQEHARARREELRISLKVIIKS